MTKYLEGNTVIWRSTQNLRTTFDSGTKAKDFELGFLLPNLQIPQTNNLTNMLQLPFPGTFVGIIAHVNVNQNNTTPEALTYEFIKTTNNGTVFVNTGVKCVVPGSNFGTSTGFFFSNTDISEFTRTWQAGEWISVRQTKGLPSGAFSGINPVTLMILLDIEPEAIP